MKIDAQLLYLQLKELVSTMPDLTGDDWATERGRTWMARAYALIEASGDVFEATTIRTAMDGLASSSHARSIQTILNSTHRVLAKAELAAPSAVRGQFISAGETLSALAAVTKVFARAKNDLLLVDAYADHTLITDFAVTAPESIHVRILAADKEGRKASIRPALLRWREQFGAARPLSVRVVPANALHDRLIVVDETETWHPGQSFNGLASRALTSISRDDAELAAQKVAAYASLWASGTELQ